MTYRIREGGAKEEIRHYNELLLWRRQELQHEQPVGPLRRSTNPRRQKQFLQLEEDRQSYQYSEPLGNIVE